MIDEGPPEPVLVVLQESCGTLRVTGPEAKTWLNGLVTCDVLQVSEEKGAFGLALNKQGKIQSEVQIVATPEGLLVGVSAGVDEKLCAALDSVNQRAVATEKHSVSAVRSACLAVSCVRSSTRSEFACASAGATRLAIRASTLR